VELVFVNVIVDIVVYVEFITFEKCVKYYPVAGRLYVILGSSTCNVQPLES
jgi:hypothetical protein